MSKGKKLSADIVKRLREDKTTGASLATLADKYQCAKSTVSLYCRDLFDYPERLYLTEADARAAVYQEVLKRRAAGKRNRSSEGNYRTGSRKSIKHQCTRCGRSCKKYNGICKACYIITQALEKHRQLGEHPVIKSSRHYHPPIRIDVCVASPIERHYWIIDSTNKGVCKYCCISKQF